MKKSGADKLVSPVLELCILRAVILFYHSMRSASKCTGPPPKKPLVMVKPGPCPWELVNTLNQGVGEPMQKVVTGLEECGFALALVGSDLSSRRERPSK